MFLGIRHPRSTRLNLADLSDAPAHEITSPALSNQGAGPMKPAVGQVKWLVAALAIRRSHCQRYARPLHPTTQTWSDRELRPHQAKLALVSRWAEIILRTLNVKKGVGILLAGGAVRRRRSHKVAAPADTVVVYLRVSTSEQAA